MSINKSMSEVDIPVLRDDADTIEERLSSNAYQNLLPARYLKKDSDGNIVEEQEELFGRVARNVAVAEAVFADEYLEEEACGLSYEKVLESDSFSDEAKEKMESWSRTFEHYLEYLKFTPNSPTWFGAGTGLQQLSACFCLHPDDSMDSIYDELKKGAMVQKMGGGIGLSFSDLRPYGDVVGSTGGISSGPVSFMRVFDSMCAEIQQGSTRRGAMMSQMDISHPDVVHFINAKNKDISLAQTLLLNDPDDPTYTEFADAIEEARGLIDDEGRVPEHLRNAVEGHLSNFNISVLVDDEFMECLESGEDYTMINPRTDEPHIATEETEEMYSWYGLDEYVEVGEEVEVPAEVLWDEIVGSAWENGEPGVGYIDTVNDEHSFDVDVYSEHEILESNPCSEIFQETYDACLAEDETILTDSGVRKIKDFAEEDGTVASDSGVSEIATNASLIPQGEKNTVEVELEGSIPIECTEDHIFITEDGEVEAQNLVKNASKVKWMNDNPLSVPADMEEDGAWKAFTLGWMHGDGWLTENSIGISFNKEDGDFEVKERALEEFHDLFGERKPLKDDGVSYQEQTDRHGAFDVADSLGFNYSLATERSLPDWFYRATENEQLVFLRGLFTADAGIGGKSNKQVQYATSSYQLADELQRVLGSFGIQTRRYTHSFEERNDQIQIHITKESSRTFMQYIGFETSAKQEEYNWNPKRTYSDSDFLEVKSVEDAGSSTVYDLNVPATNVFFCNGALVHNCNLGHINLSTIVSQDRTLWHNWDGDVEGFLDQAIDWKELNERIEVGTRFLDNVVTMSDFPVEEITEKTFNSRRIGLGILGLAQLFIELGVEYGSEESNEISEELMTHINHKSSEHSRLLSEERGMFPEWNESKYSSPKEYPDWFERHTGENPEEWSDGYPQRNVCTTMIAPTGSTSILARSSGGCEPIYNVAYFKNVTDDIQGEEMMVEFDSLFLQTLEENDIDVDEVKEEAERKMNNNEFDGPASLSTVPDEISRLFVTTSDLSPEDHASIMCSLQEGVQQSISKTLNAPHDATVEDAKDGFEYVYENGGKSVTFYRDGSRSKQVNTTRKDNTDVNAEEGGSSDSNPTLEPRERPKTTPGETHQIDTPQGTLYVTINEDWSGEPFEMFMTIGKSGGTIESFSEGLARMVSLNLRSGVKLDSIIDQLQNIRSPEVQFDNGETIYSVPDAVATVLERYQETDNSMMNHPTTDVDIDRDDEQQESGEACPLCGTNLAYVEGCQKCPSDTCSYSAC